MTDDQVLWVVFGLDKDGKPHGSRFTADEAEQAQRAATALSYIALEVTDPELKRQAEVLAPGRLYSAGKAFAPFIKTETYLALAKAAGGGATSPGPAGAAGDASAEDLWAGVSVGSRVLATAPGIEGWWECDVVAVSDQGSMLTLRWTGYDDEPAFACPRARVGLMRPDKLASA
jgi:hypothetical protein